MGEKMSLERVRDGLRKMEPEGEWWSPGSGMTHWTVPIKAWADAIDAHLTQPAQAVDDTRRLQFVLDHVPHSVLADFGVLPPMCDLPEGEAHIEDARATIDKALPNANGKEDTDAAR